MPQEYGARKDRSRVNDAMSDELEHPAHRGKADFSMPSAALGDTEVEWADVPKRRRRFTLSAAAPQ